MWILQKTSHLTICDNPSEISRSLIAALMCSPLILVWPGHFSCIRVCNVISWQMKCVIQILTEVGVATTKWNLKFLCRHLNHLMTVTSAQCSLVYMAHICLVLQCRKPSNVQVVFQQITVVFESVIHQRVWTGSRLHAILLVASVLEVF